MAAPGNASRTRRADAGSKLSGVSGPERRPAEQEDSGGEASGRERSHDADADPAIRRSGDPAIRRSGDPAIRRSGDPAIRRSGDPAIRRSGDPAIRRSGDPAIRRSGDPAIRRSGDYTGNGKRTCQADFPGSRRKRRHDLLHASDHRQITLFKGEPDNAATRRRRNSHDILHWPCTNLAGGREAIECAHVGPRRRMAVPVIVAAQRTTGPGERAQMTRTAAWDMGRRVLHEETLSVRTVFDGAGFALSDGHRLPVTAKPGGSVGRSASMAVSKLPATGRELDADWDGRVTRYPASLGVRCGNGFR